MDPTKVFCDNGDCPDRGKVGCGNIKVHCKRSKRYRCTTCTKTFAATKGTPLYRLHKDHSLFVTVVTLLSHGCPPPAIVAAYGLDERTVAHWYAKSGEHARGAHEHFLQNQPVDLQHVQATERRLACLHAPERPRNDELYTKCQGSRGWMAMAMSVPHRLWLGGVCRPVRNLHLIQRLVDMVRVAWLPGRPLLVCVDGLASYPTAFWRAFREKVLTGRRGRPSYRLPDGISLGQVIKKHSGRCLLGVVRRVLWGTPEQVQQQLHKTDTGEQINTSYIERLNATFRSAMAALTRRGRRLLRCEGVLEKGMYLSGCVYNFCKEHKSLRVRRDTGPKWHQRTPAMAAGWADHPWSIRELLEFRPAPASHG